MEMQDLWTGLNVHGDFCLNYKSEINKNTC